MTTHPEPGLYERIDSQPGGVRSGLLDHAAGCAACRERLLRGDASRLFALLALPPVPERALDRLAVGLERELDRVAPRRRAPYLLRTGAALAASLILAGFFGVYVLRAPRAGSPVAAVETAPAAVVAGEMEAPAGEIRLISSPGEAQVVELAIGETRVTMIFDKALDI